MLPGTAVAREAGELFRGRGRADPANQARIAELKLITPHYQHVDGTSFAAPMVAAAAACVLEANPRLAPRAVRDVLLASAEPIAGVAEERQGRGVLSPGRAIAHALREHHSAHLHGEFFPRVIGRLVSFGLHDHAARQVEVFGDWNQWRESLRAEAIEPGLWRTPALALPPGRHGYKFLLDGQRWLHDPDNPHKAPDGLGSLNAVVTIPE